MQKELASSVFWIFISIILIILTLIRISLFDYGFCTAWDESYFLVKCQEAYIGDYVTGKSLWNYIAIKWFPYLDLSSKIDACSASLILEACASIIGTIACVFLFGKDKIIKYFSINYLLCFLWGTSFAGDVVNYVPLHAFLIYTATCSSAIAIKYSQYWFRSIFFIAAGIALGLSFFVILPSTVLLGLCLLFVIAFISKSLKNTVRYVVEIVIGLAISILYIHLFVCDLHRVAEAMSFTAKYITKVGYGYSPMSFVIQIALFAKDYLFTILFYIGAYFAISLLPRKLSWISGIVYFILMIILFRYQIKPRVTPAMILSSVILISFLFEEKKEKWTDWLFGFMVFILPIIGSIGTNTYLGSRMICYMAPWALYIAKKEMPKFVLASSVIILLINPLDSYPKQFLNRDDNYHFTKGLDSFSKISLTKEQSDYLNNTYEIMTDYGFEPNKSVVFTTEYDYATAYAFKAKLSSNFYQKNNFLHVDRSGMLRPDFIFLSQWDKMVLEKELIEMPWGYPDEYDEYFVGTPESPNFEWDSNRWLYCRKTEEK